MGAAWALTGEMQQQGSAAQHQSLVYEKDGSHRCLEPDHPVQLSWYVFRVVVQYSLLSTLEPACSTRVCHGACN